MTGILYAQTDGIGWELLNGPYLGQKPPGSTPVIFAQGIVSTEQYNHSSVSITPDGCEIYWAMGPLDHPRRIYVSKWLPDGWSRPEIVSFTRDDDGDCPVLSTDGQRLYFNSNRPMVAGKTRRERYWVAERRGDDWAEPRPLSLEINDGHLHWQSSIDRSGNFYFGSARTGSKGKDDVFVTALSGEGYGKPVSMDETINTAQHECCPYIAPDGSYLIFGRGGLQISFREEDGTWTEAKSLGERFEGAICPYVSPDGKYLFFLTHSPLGAPA